MGTAVIWYYNCIIVWTHTVTRLSPLTLMQKAYNIIPPKCLPTKTTTLDDLLIASLASNMFKPENRSIIAWIRNITKHPKSLNRIARLTTNKLRSTLTISKCTSNRRSSNYILQLGYHLLKYDICMHHKENDERWSRFLQ